MNFRIADTFTDSLARLSADEQKAAKTTAFDLQMNPANPGMQFHRLDKAKDKNFWSVRVNRDVRMIVHRSDDSMLLCYVDHHDRAYDWAERRKLETHPKTGAAQVSRDIDLLVLADDANLGALSRASATMEAKRIAVPPFDPAAMRRGHAVHFRSQAPGCHGLRIDVISRLRGLPPFETLWNKNKRTKSKSKVKGMSLYFRPFIFDFPFIFIGRHASTTRNHSWRSIEKFGLANALAEKPHCCILGSCKQPFQFQVAV